MDDARLEDRLALQELKARYFRYLDTKQWAAWRALFTDDMVFVNDDAPVPSVREPMTASGDDFVEMVSATLEHAVTVHQGHMPEIQFTGDDAATGVWAMSDWVDSSAAGGTSMQGFGHYHERYVRGEDGRWRIAELRLTRLRTDLTSPTGRTRPEGSPGPWKRPADATRVSSL
jgi:hypothetical protein